MLGSWFATHAPPGSCDGPRSVGYVDPAMHPAAKSNASSCRRSSAVWFGVVGSDYGHNPPLKRISCLLNPIFGWVVPDFIPNWQDHRQEPTPSGINQEPEKMPMEIC